MSIELYINISKYFGYAFAFVSMGLVLILLVMGIITLVMKLLVLKKSTILFDKLIDCIDFENLSLFSSKNNFAHVFLLFNIAGMAASGIFGILLFSITYFFFPQGWVSFISDFHNLVYHIAPYVLGIEIVWFTLCLIHEIGLFYNGDHDD